MTAATATRLTTRPVSLGYLILADYERKTVREAIEYCEKMRTALAALEESLGNLAAQNGGSEEAQLVVSRLLSFRTHTARFGGFIHRFGDRLVAELFDGGKLPW